MIIQNWWFTTLLGIKDPIQPPLTKNSQADILIIGGGAAGLSAAYTLMNKGHKIVLLERNICGGSSAGKSAGFLTPDSELELSQLLRRFGKKGASDLWGLATMGVDLIAERIKKHEINCDFQVQDSLFLGIGRNGRKSIEQEMASRKLLEFVQTEYNETELKTHIGSESYTGAVRYPGTFGINPLLYCQELKKILLENGVEIYEASEVISVKDHTAYTNLGSVKAGQIIFCADKIKPQISHFSKNIYHAQTFLSISEPLSDKMIDILFPKGKYQCWDSKLVYSYFRLTGDNRLLLGGGSMLTTFSKNDVNSSIIIDNVIRKFKTRFPHLEDLKFIQYWPGRIDTTRDLLPTITHDESTPWIHFVLGCVGLPWATFSGNFVARKVINELNENEKHLLTYFRSHRHFLVPLWMENLIGKQLVFSLNNGWSKYYQKDN